VTAVTAARGDKPGRSSAAGQQAADAGRRREPFRARRRSQHGSAHGGFFAVPILILIILAILVAQIGFWDTFAAVLGAIGVVLLVMATAVTLLFLVGFWLFRRARRLT
jgi:hypothetical protein